VSPIFVRPVREQAEHDRLIRYLQAKYKRKFDVAVNFGEERVAPIKVGAMAFFPDLVLSDGKKLAGVVEVESGESVNNLEAMAQWANFSRARVPFHLYVPVQAYDAARRLCDANQARPAEVWTYRPGAEGFDLVRMFADSSAVAGARAAERAQVRAEAAKAAPAKPAPQKTGGKAAAGKPAVKSGAGKPPAAKPVAPRPAKTGAAGKSAKNGGRKSPSTAKAKSKTAPKSSSRKGKKR
jgi:hypothetical protein